MDLLVANGAKGHEKNPRVHFVRGTYDLYLGGGVEKNSWLLLKLIGRVSNTEGIGAIIRANANGKIYSRTATHGVHSKTQDDPRVHFGFGELQKGDKVKLDIIWPCAALVLFP